MRLLSIAAVSFFSLAVLGTCFQMNGFENFEYGSFDSLDRQNAPAEQFFTQQLDHFDTFNNTTWKQV